MFFHKISVLQFLTINNFQWSYIIHMDHIQLYKNCNEVLQLLMTTQYTIFYDDLNRISLEYASLIIQEYTYKGFAKKLQIKK